MQCGNLMGAISQHFSGNLIFLDQWMTRTLPMTLKWSRENAKDQNRNIDRWGSIWRHLLWIYLVFQPSSVFATTCTCAGQRLRCSRSVNSSIHVDQRSSSALACGHIWSFWCIFLSSDCPTKLMFFKIPFKLLNREKNWILHSDTWWNLPNETHFSFIQFTFKICLYC